MNLREAIRQSWAANRLLNEALDNQYDQWIIENRKADADLAEQEVERWREKTPLWLVINDDNCTVDGLSESDITHLFAIGLLYECASCEEDEGYAEEFDGQDHREFHLTGEHLVGCLYRELDRLRKPTPSPLFFVCQQCGG